MRWPVVISYYPASAMVRASEVLKKHRFPSVARTMVPLLPVP